MAGAAAGHKGFFAGGVRPRAPFPSANRAFSTRCGAFFGRIVSCGLSAARPTASFFDPPRFAPRSAGRRPARLPRDTRSSPSTAGGCVENKHRTFPSCCQDIVVRRDSALPPPLRATVFTHLRSPRGSLPQLAGEGGAKRRMGCGPLLRRQTACTNVTANLRSKRPAFHTPSVAFGDTFPASRRRGRPAAACRLDDLCESGSLARRGRGVGGMARLPSLASPTRGVGIRRGCVSRQGQFPPSSSRLAITCA